MGIRYHKQVHLVAFFFAILFTISGLFFQTNLMLENMTSANFSRRLQEFPRNVLSQVTSASTLIIKAHRSQQHNYLNGFWLTVIIFAVLTIVCAVLLLHSRTAETHAYLLAGKSSADIALQCALEAFTVFVAGFTIIALLSLLASAPFVNFVSNHNHTAFIGELNRGDSSGLSLIKASLSGLFKNRVTDFNIHSLLYGRGIGDQLLQGPAGYSISFAFGAVIVVLINFIFTFFQALRMRTKL